MSESPTRAFPARLAAVVTGIEQSLPVGAFGPTGSVTVSNSRAWPGLVVAGEPVVIPMRVALTTQRAISHWSCYYQGLHALQDTYPALAALSMLGDSATT